MIECLVDFIKNMLIKFWQLMVPLRLGSEGQGGIILGTLSVRLSDHGTRMNHSIYTESNGPAFLTLNHLKHLETRGLPFQRSLASADLSPFYRPMAGFPLA